MHSEMITVGWIEGLAGARPSVGGSAILLLADAGFEDCWVLERISRLLFVGALEKPMTLQSLQHLICLNDQ